MDIESFNAFIADHELFAETLRDRDTDDEPHPHAV